MTEPLIAPRWQMLALVLLVGFAVYLLAPVLTPFAIAAMFAYLFDPVVERLQRMGLGRNAAVAIVFLALTLLLFLILLPLAASPRIRAKPGIVLGTFIAWYGLSRFLVEFVREPDAQLGYLMGTDWFTRGQQLSIPMILIGLAVVLWAARRPAVEAPAPAPSPST